MNLFINFLTAAAAIYSIGYVLVLIGLFVIFYRLPRFNQLKTKINIPTSSALLFLISVSFLIAVYVS